MARRIGALLVDVGPLRDSPAFRRLFVARTVMLVGVGLVGLTVPLQAYALTASTSAVAVVAAVEAVAFVAGFLGGGVLTDRTDRWRVIGWVRVLCTLSFAGLAANALWVDSLGLLVAFVALNGVSAAAGITAMLAVVPGLVGSDRLHAAGALNTISLRLGAVVSPAVGGVVLAAAGPAWNYGAATVAATATLPLLRRPAGAAPSATTGSAAEPAGRALPSAYRFVRDQPVVRGVMTAGVVGMVGGGSFVLIPALVATRFAGDPTVVGLMYAALGTGTVAGSVASGWVARVRRPGVLLLSAMTVAFLGLAGAGAAGSVGVALACLLVAGAAVAVEEVLRFALIQGRTPDRLLGRVTSAFAAQNMSATAVGALLAGVVERMVGPDVAFGGLNLALALVAVLTAAALPGLRAATPDRAGPTPWRRAS